MNCPRCTGLMMSDDFLDLEDEEGRYKFVAWRCLICGEVIDPVILKHRVTRPAPMVDRARPQLHRRVLIHSMNRADRSGDLWGDPEGTVSLLKSNETVDLMSLSTS